MSVEKNGLSNAAVPTTTLTAVNGKAAVSYAQTARTSHSNLDTTAEISFCMHTSTNISRRSSHARPNLRDRCLIWSQSLLVPRQLLYAKREQPKHKATWQRQRTKIYITHGYIYISIFDTSQGRLPYNTRPTPGQPVAKRAYSSNYSEVSSNKCIHLHKSTKETELTKMYNDFYNSSIEADVGINCNSISLFTRHITMVNEQRPEKMRKDNNALTLRLLYAITRDISPAMYGIAFKEITAPPKERCYQDVATGMRDFASAASDLDNKWRTMFTCGQIVTTRPIQVDASMAQPIVENVSDIHTAPRRILTHMKTTAYATLMPNETTDTKDTCQHIESDFLSYNAKGCNSLTSCILSETNCWNCRGFGHDKWNCPSPCSNRPIANTMQAYAKLCEDKTTTTATARPAIIARHNTKDPPMEIPATIDAAINDMRFSSQWRMAIKIEFDKLVEAGFKNIFLNGKWAFKTTVDTKARVIYFRARCNMPTM